MAPLTGKCVWPYATHMTSDTTLITSGDAPCAALMINDEVTSAKPITSGNAQLSTLMNSGDAPMKEAARNSCNALNPNTPN